MNYKNTFKEEIQMKLEELAEEHEIDLSEIEVNVQTRKYFKKFNYIGLNFYSKHSDWAIGRLGLATIKDRNDFESKLRGFNLHAMNNNGICFHQQVDYFEHNGRKGSAK